jgi:hypothetical protein
VKIPKTPKDKERQSVVVPVRAPLIPTEDQPHPYRHFTTHTLLSTLVSLRVTTTIHGSTERTTEVARLIRAELAGRARLGDTDAAEDPFRHYEGSGEWDGGRR